jgi:hypothetical protein
MRTHRKDAGFSLAALIFFLTAASIFIAAAVPAYQMQAKREMEAELIFRGEEYVRAIQKYQRKFNVYPTSIEQLVSTNGLRFLRRPYKDPFTEKEFRLITLNPDFTVNGSKLYQQNMGTQSLFGGNTQTFRPGQNPQQQQFQPGQQLGFPQAGQQTPGGQQQTPGFQTPGGQSQGQQGFGQQVPGQQQQQQQQGFRVGGQQFGQPQQGAGRNQQAGGTPGISNTLGGTQIAAGGIIGVASDSDKQSIKVYNNRQKYDEWEFIAILGQQGPQGQPGQNPQQQNPNAPPNQLQNQNPFGPRNNPAFQPVPGNPLGGPPTSSPFGPLGGPQGGGQRPIQNPFGFGGTPQQQPPQPGKLP